MVKKPKYIFLIIYNYLKYAIVRFNESKGTLRKCHDTCHIDWFKNIPLPIQCRYTL